LRRAIKMLKINNDQAKAQTARLPNIALLLPLSPSKYI
jgi:hypothetical protein